MTPGIRAKLQEMAKRNAKGTEKCSQLGRMDGFMSGAEAGYDLGVKEERERIRQRLLEWLLERGDCKASVADEILRPKGEV